MNKKNILLLLVDGCRADRVGAYGYKKRITTPNIDAIAKNSFICNENYATSFCTMPSVVSLMTGLYPCKHKATATWAYNSTDHPFLPEILKDYGYETFGVSNNVVAMSPEMGFIKGYETYYRIGRESNWFKESKEEQRGMKIPSFATRLKRRGIKLLEKLSKKSSQNVVTKIQTSWYSENDMGGKKAVITFLDGIKELKKNKPFFAYVNIPETHHPFLTIKEFSETWGKPDITENLLKLVLQPNEFEEESRDLTESEIETLQLLYDTNVHYADYLVGKVVDGLRERGMYDDTVIIIFGDHGGNTWEKKHLYGSSSFTYEQEIKVPLIIANTDLKGKTDKLTSLIDVFPTILDIVNIPKESFTSNGKSLLQDDLGHESVLIDYPAYPTWLKNMCLNQPKILVKYGKTNRTIVTSNKQKFIWLSDGMHERYDLNNDPEEKNNLYKGCLEDLMYINMIKEKYKELLGPIGECLEIYNHNDIGENNSLLPSLDKVNPNFTKDVVRNV